MCFSLGVTYDKVNRVNRRNLPQGYSRPFLAGVHAAYSKKSVSLALMGKAEHTEPSTHLSAEVSLGLQRGRKWLCHLPRASRYALIG